MTTDWTAEAQAGVDRWLETQRAWWTTILGGTGAAAGAAGASDDARRDAVEAWRKSARSLVDAQADGLLAMLGDQPKDADELLRRWTDAQRELLQGWLAVAGGAGDPGQGMQDAGRQMVESLRQAAEQLVQSQAQWAQAWADAQAGRPQGGPADGPADGPPAGGPHG